MESQNGELLEERKTHPNNSGFKMRPESLKHHGHDFDRRLSALSDDPDIDFMGILSRRSSDDEFKEFLENIHSLNWVHDNQEGPTHSFHLDVDGNISQHQLTFKADSPKVSIVPLRQWNKYWNDRETRYSMRREEVMSMESQKAMLLRKTSIAFGFATIIQHVTRQTSVWNKSFHQIESLLSIDNFAMEVSNDETADLGWEVRGVKMISPLCSVELSTDSYYHGNVFNVDVVDQVEIESLGRKVFATMKIPLVMEERKSSGDGSEIDENTRCYFAGVLFHSFFSDSVNSMLSKRLQGLPNDDRNSTVTSSTPNKTSSFVFLRSDLCGLCDEGQVVGNGPYNNNSTRNQAASVDSYVDQSNCVDHMFRKKMSSERPPHNLTGVNDVGMQLIFQPLTDLGYPPNISHLVNNLIDCGLGLFRPDESYPSLGAAIDDLQLMLQEPRRFLFRHHSTDSNASYALESKKLYGRSNEVKDITDAFCRVASTGESEAIFVSGFSGCGKTRLVESVFESVVIARGIVIVRKFDEMSSPRPLTVVLSLFNDLCQMILESFSKDEVNDVCQALLGVFGTNFYLLSRVLPNVVDLFPSNNKPPSLSHQPETSVNFNSLVFVIQKFMSVVSKPSRPMLFFLDDLQWADEVSLKLVYSLLSDGSSWNCILLIGGYRDNKVFEHDINFFFESPSVMTKQTIHLDGICVDDMKSLISEMLGVFPRLCRSLSDIVYRKTKGNPYFALEFLRSLISRKLVSYSLRERRWSWDVNVINNEDISGNVLHLLTTKIAILPERKQTALKVASCFGIQISAALVRLFDSTSEYSDLRAQLDEVVEEGFMECDGTAYRFAHDKVREAAYGLIGCDDRDQYHFNIGMALQVVVADQIDVENGILFATAEQMNRGRSTLLASGTQTLVDAVMLNYKVGVVSMESSNFTLAHSSMKCAVILLPTDSWISHYDLSLKCFLQLAKSAYPCGYAIEAKDAVKMIVKNAKRLDDKLEAYFLLVSVLLLAEDDLMEAIDTCLYVLKLLGMKVLIDDCTVSDDELNSQIYEAKHLLQSDSSIFEISEISCGRPVAIMQFFSLMCHATFLSKPRLHKYISARWALFCLREKVLCKFTPTALVTFAVTLCSDFMSDDMKLGFNIGTKAFAMMNRNMTSLYVDELPGVYSAYYMQIGNVIQPIQACADICRRGYEIGMQIGNPSIAALNISLAINQDIFGGKNLATLKGDIEFHQHAARIHSQPFLTTYLCLYHNVVTALIGTETPGSLESCNHRCYNEFYYLYQMMSSLYRGHYERVIFMSKQFESLTTPNEDINIQLRTIAASFFVGLAAGMCCFMKKQNRKYYSIIEKSLKVLERACEVSAWNFQNKLSMIRAISMSVQRNSYADDEFDNAISSARSSKFIHEEGLFCELASMHFRRHGHLEKSLSLLRQAESCYRAWGSQTKAKQMKDQIESPSAAVMNIKSC